MSPSNLLNLSNLSTINFVNELEFGHTLLANSTNYTITLYTAYLTDRWGNQGTGTQVLGLYHTPVKVNSIAVATTGTYPGTLDITTPAIPVYYTNTTSPVTFTVTLASAVPALTTSNFTIEDDGAGATGATIVSATPNVGNTIYTVTVNVSSVSASTQERVIALGIANDNKLDASGALTVKGTYNLKRAFDYTLTSTTPTGTTTSIVASNGDVTFAPADVVTSVNMTNAITMTPVPATPGINNIVFDATNNKVTFDYGKLAYATTYALKLSAGAVRDKWSNLNAEISSSFTTLNPPALSSIVREVFLQLVQKVVILARQCKYSNIGSYI